MSRVAIVGPRALDVLGSLVKAVTKQGDNIMSLAIHPAPSANVLELLAEGRQSKAIFTHRRESAIEIGNLVIKLGLLESKKAVLENTEMPLTEQNIRAATAQAVRQAEFVAELERMGIEDGFERSEGTCDCCDANRRVHGPGVMYYSPDASGSPTPTLFQCNDCFEQSGALKGA